MCCIFVENVSIPTLWFLSASRNYNVLWSFRNTIFKKHPDTLNFKIIGDWKPNPQFPAHLSKGTVFKSIFKSDTVHALVFLVKRINSELDLEAGMNQCELKRQR